MNEEELLKFLLRWYESAKSDQTGWDTQMQEAADYVRPHRGDFNVRTTQKGHRRSSQYKVFDSTPIWANEQLAAGLMGLLLQAEEPWFGLRTKNVELMEIDETRFWTQAVRDHLMDIFNSTKSGFLAHSHEIMLDLGAFGTACLFTENSQQGPIFRSRHMGECTPVENEKGVIDTLFRDFPLSLRKVVEKFGEGALSDRLAERYQKGGKELDKEIEVVHIVYPNNTPNTHSFGPGRWAFPSVYMELETKSFLSRSGFEEFPFQMPRWSKLTGESRGRSPAMLAMPDIKMLNRMMQTTIRAAQKVVDPPMMVPDDGFLGPLRTAPSSMLYYRAGTQDRIEPLVTNGRVELGLEMINQTREQIIKMFFADLLQLPDRDKSHQEMRQVEVVTRKSDRMTLMAPQVNRLQNEYLGPVVRRTYNIEARAGRLPPLPEVLSGEKLEIEYVSQLARSQKLAQVNALMEWAQIMAPMAETDPTILDNLDGDGAARWVHRLLRLPPETLKPLEVVEQTRAQRQQDAAIQQAAQTAGDLSGSVKDVAQAAGILSG